MPMFDATAKAVTERDRWTQDHELLAVIAEHVYALHDSFVRANSKNGGGLPKWSVRRPGEPDGVPTVTHQDMRLLAGG